VITNDGEVFHYLFCTTNPLEIDFLGHLIQSSKPDGSIYFYFITVFHKPSMERILHITFIAKDCKMERTFYPQLHYFLSLMGFPFNWKYAPIDSLSCPKIPEAHFPYLF
jgi:hypothetical protein